VHWLVYDSLGSAWRGVPPKPFDQCTLQGAELLDYYLINCGFAAIGMSRNGVLVRLRPAAVSDAALVSVLFRLADAGHRSIAVELFDEKSWTCAIVGSDGEAAASRLADVIACRLPAAHQAVLRRPLHLAAIPPDCPLLYAIRTWEEIGCGAMPDLGPLLHNALHGRYAWVERETQRSPLVLTEIGHGFPDSMKAFLEASLGRRIDGQPDPMYARYCRDAYGTAADTGRPLLEAVDALLMLPGYGRVRRTYRRLILPFQPSVGRLRLLCASIEDDTVDLRGVAA
jgi:hypothetical protein